MKNLIKMISVCLVFSLVLGLSLVIAEDALTDSESGAGAWMNKPEAELYDGESGKQIGGDVSPEMIQAKTQVQVVKKLQDGTHTGVNGEQIKVMVQSNNQKQLEVGGIKAKTGLEIMSEDENGKSRLKVNLSNGRNAEIKVMPNTAAEKALERLRIRVCNEENNCQIELKETGSDNEKELGYEVQIERHSRILGIFAKKMQVKAEVNAENGEVEKIKKPWWAFIATEPEE